MAPRANWKGYLRLSLVSCPIALGRSFSCEPSDRVGPPPRPLKGLRAPIAKLLLLLPQS
jgi:hypothetical protein